MKTRVLWPGADTWPENRLRMEGAGVAEELLAILDNMWVEDRMVRALPSRNVGVMEVSHDDASPAALQTMSINHGECGVRMAVVVMTGSVMHSSVVWGKLDGTTIILDDEHPLDPYLAEWFGRDGRLPFDDPKARA